MTDNGANKRTPGPGNAPENGTVLVFIRHGETDWNREARWQGQADVPLNPSGREQAKRMAEELSRRMRVDVIYSSDLSRAHDTALALAGATGAPVHLDPRLREVDQGEWQGKRVLDIREQYADLFARRLADPWLVAPPGGESAAQVAERMKAALHQIVARHPGQVIAIVSHGFVLAVARVLAAGEPVERLFELVPDNCIPLEVQWKG